jgi:hypothetical protein
VLIFLDQIVCKDKKTASRILAGEAIVLTPMNSKIYNLNETGSRIWAWLDDRPTVGELAARMQSEFKVDEEQAQADIIAFLEELVARGMVALGESSEAG